MAEVKTVPTDHTRQLLRIRDDNVRDDIKWLAR